MFLLEILSILEYSIFNKQGELHTLVKVLLYMIRILLSLYVSSYLDAYPNTVHGKYDYKKVLLKILSS